LIGSGCTLEDAFGFVAMLKGADISPNVQTYGALMAKAERERRPEVVLKIYQDMQANGIPLNQIVCTLAIAAQGRAGRPGDADKVFRDMELQGHPADVKAFGALMSVHARHGDSHAVEALHAEIVARGLDADDRILGTRVLAQAKAGRLDRALVLFGEMLDAKIEPHIAVCHTLIAACEKPRSSDLALWIFKGMIQRGTWPNGTTFSTLMRTCVASEKLDITFAAIESSVACGLLKLSVGYDASSNCLSLWAYDVMKREKEWPRSASTLADVGAALAEFHIALGHLTPGSSITGPEPARLAAVRRAAIEWKD
jgi:pentatricopeptide repeat protein